MEGMRHPGMGNPEEEPRLSREEMLQAMLDAFAKQDYSETDRYFGALVAAHPDWSPAYHNYAALRMNYILADYPNLPAEDLKSCMQLFLVALEKEPRLVRHLYSAVMCAVHCQAHDELRVDDEYIIALCEEISRHPDFKTLQEDEQVQIQKIVIGESSTN